MIDPTYKSAILFKAVGHPIRIKILRVLTQYNTMTVTELSHFLSIEQPVISLHLAILRKHSILKVQKKGKQSSYSILDMSLRQAVNLVYNTYC